LKPCALNHLFFMASLIQPYVNALGGAVEALSRNLEERISWNWLLASVGTEENILKSILGQLDRLGIVQILVDNQEEVLILLNENWRDKERMEELKNVILSFKLL